MRKVCIGIFLTLFLVAGASAAPIPYWTPTDLTTGTNGNVTFVLTLENFFNPAVEADFGIFYRSGNTKTDFEVFDYLDEPTDTQNVFFQLSGGIWQVSLDNASWTNFSNVFGFYFTRRDPANLSVITDYIYSDPFFSSGPNGFTMNTTIFQLTNVEIDLFAETRDVMTVNGIDLAAVPEPTTMLLFGLGLIGFGTVARRRLH